MNFVKNLYERWQPKWHVYLILGLFIPVFFTVYLLKIHPQVHPAGDTPSYLAGAYNIKTFNVFSDERGKVSPTPKALRTPAYSWFLAQSMKYVPGLDKADYSWFMSPEQKELSAEFIKLKYPQLFLLLGIAGMTAWLVLSITGKKSYGQWALWITAFHPFLSKYVDRLYSELFGVFVITLFTFLFYLALKHGKALLSLLAGAALGCVVLTFAQWTYVAPICFVTIAIYGITQRQRLTKTLVTALIFIAGFTAVTHPWTMRNQDLFKKDVISGRGGDILELRSHLDMMPIETYLASFCYWSHSPLLKKPLKAFVDREHYALLDSDDPSSVYAMVEQTRVRVHKEFPDNPLMADNKQLNESKKRILAHPIRHILVSIPIAFRGMMDGTLSLFNLPIYFFFVYAFFMGIKRKNWLLAATLAPAGALLAFNALATHGHPRYSGQVVSIVWVGALAGLNIYLQKRKDKKNALLAQQS